MDRRGERANYRADCSSLILQKKIRKFAKNKQTNKQTDRQTENSITEATLIPCGLSGGAGQQIADWNNNSKESPSNYIELFDINVEEKRLKEYVMDTLLYGTVQESRTVEKKI